MNLYKPISERGKGRREGRAGDRRGGTEGRKEKREGVEKRERARDGKEGGRKGGREKEIWKAGGRGERERTRKKREGGREGRERGGRKRGMEKERERREKKREEKEREEREKCYRCFPIWQRDITQPDTVQKHIGDTVMFIQGLSHPHGFLSFRKQFVYVTEILQAFKTQASKRRKRQKCAVCTYSPKHLYSS